MKLIHVHAAARAVNERQRLIEQRDRAPLGVTIAGKFQDASLTELIRPIVTAELNRQIAEIDADLEAIGVEVAAQT